MHCKLWQIEIIEKGVYVFPGPANQDKDELGALSQQQLSI
jgi:hypothetical protein